MGSPLERKGCAFGSHRVLEPPGAFPQSAWRLDSTPVVFDNEILCDVDALNVDSASFRQIAESCEDDAGRIAARILEIVRERGKQHNPHTGSGGIFVGRVREIGAAIAARGDVRPGDRIASLVSLTLTPLAIEEIVRIDMTSGRVWVKGTAVLFERSSFAPLPDDIPAEVALAVLDVAGAPAQVRRLATPGGTVAVVGADGKSGMLACAQARDRVGVSGRVVGIAPSAETAGARFLIEGNYVDAFIAADARSPLEILGEIPQALPELADLTVNCVNVPGTELASILCTKDGGSVYFFSMSTSFTAAALGAEGVAKDVTMIVGNGYTKGHAEIALQTLRDHPALLAHFVERYGVQPEAA
ncbi:MAG: L-erythro-3,5-diaminohexanoate dehydrogenase [Candidatus Eremiobacteraeota bacterium]|nr:L-erythro-3,5-diaminohexanoate dehydrogenase [Candidatus Eremiobacteraeota bacterium]